MGSGIRSPEKRVGGTAIKKNQEKKLNFKNSFHFNNVIYMFFLSCVLYFLFYFFILINEQLIEHLFWYCTIQFHHHHQNDMHFFYTNQYTWTLHYLKNKTFWNNFLCTDRWFLCDFIVIPICLIYFLFLISKIYCEPGLVRFLIYFLWKESSNSYYEKKRSALFICRALNMSGCNWCLSSFKKSNRNCITDIVINCIPDGRQHHWLNVNLKL